MGCKSKEIIIFWIKGNSELENSFWFEPDRVKAVVFAWQPKPADVSTRDATGTKIFFNLSTKTRAKPVFIMSGSKTFYDAKRKLVFFLPCLKINVLIKTFALLMTVARINIGPGQKNNNLITKVWSLKSLSMFLKVWLSSWCEPHYCLLRWFQMNDCY